jgi:hypothetical protein
MPSPVSNEYCYRVSIFHIPCSHYSLDTLCVSITSNTQRFLRSVCHSVTKEKEQGASKAYLWNLVRFSECWYPNFCVQHTSRLAIYSEQNVAISGLVWKSRGRLFTYPWYVLEVKNASITEVVSLDRRVERSSSSSMVIWRSDSCESKRTVVERWLSNLRIVYSHEGMEGGCANADGIIELLRGPY